MLPGYGISTAIYVLMSLAWLVVAYVVLREATRALVAPRDRWTLALVALLVAALAVRLALATWGPGDDQLRIREIFFPAFVDLRHAHANPHLGSAPLVLWWPLSALLPISDTGVIAVALALGAAAPVLLALALRDLGASRLAALSAGGLLALHSVAVRFSGDMSRMSYVVFLGLAALWGLARHHRQGGWRPLALFVAAAWLCARSRPEAGVILGVAGLVLLVVRLDGRARLRDPRFRAELAALGVAGLLGVGSLVLAAQYEEAIGGHLSRLFDGLGFLAPANRPWLDPGYTSAVALFLGAAGLALGARRRDRVTLWAAASLLLVAFGTPHDQTTDYKLAYARYHGLGIALFCALAGLGVHHLRAALAGRVGAWPRRALGGALAGGVLATSAGPLVAVCEPRTMDLEFRFLRDALQTLPACAVIHRPYELTDTFSGGFREPDRVSRFLRRGAWRGWPPAPSGDAACPAYVYLPAACHAGASYGDDYRDLERIKDRCREGAARHTGSPAIVADLPARTFGNDLFERDVLRVGFYALDEGPGRSRTARADAAPTDAARPAE